MPNRVQEAEDALCGSMEMQAFMALIRRTPALHNSSHRLPSVTRPMRSRTIIVTTEQDS